MPKSSSIQKTASSKTEKPHYFGHRERLRKKFLEHGHQGLAHYELLEILLSLAIPQKDVKPLAKRLLEFYKDLKGVIEASPSDISKHFKLSEKTVAALKIISAIHIEINRSALFNVSILDNSKAVVDYCRRAMQNIKKEQVRLFFLDKKHQLIKEEVNASGTIDQVALYPREIVEQVVLTGASGVIIVHNHPSGDPKPSSNDISLTNDIQQALRHIHVHLFDHIIIGSKGIYSFRNSGLL